MRCNASPLRSAWSDGGLAVTDRRTDVARDQLQLAEIAGAMAAPPILPLDVHVRAARIGSRASVSRPSARKQEPASLSSQAWSGGVRLGETRRQGGVEETGDGPQVGAEGAKLVGL